ncbi:hypothetical protein B6U99_02075, partial [Candidatus Geothermarchaeota archaeon ex4572_27]
VLLAFPETQLLSGLCQQLGMLQYNLRVSDVQRLIDDYRCRPGFLRNTINCLLVSFGTRSP